MPKRIKNLLCPPISKQRLTNLIQWVTNDIFSANHNIMTVHKLKSYILEQRQRHYSFVLKCREVETFLAFSRSGKKVDGNSLNIQKYSKISSITIVDLGKVQNSITFLIAKEGKANVLLDELRASRNSIITSGGSQIAEWRSYELKFYTCRIKTLNDNIVDIQKLIST